jgi:hypothetical protein
MTIAHRFHSAANADFYDLLDIPVSDQRYLLVSALNLSEYSHTALMSPENVLKIPLEREVDVDETLNTITKWMRDNDALNQHRYYDRFGSYNISFHFVDEGAVYPSLTHEFTLRDYVFLGNDGDNPGNFDGFMIMLDRHRLAKDMREGLLTDERYNIPERADAAQFWCLYVRQCSHPDYRSQRTELGPALVNS